LDPRHARLKMAGMSNAVLFASVAREYANFRPGYPAELFEWLARTAPRLQAVWDCGCGSGQASTALATHFGVVYATDVAPEQIAAARPHPRVRYAVAPAEACGLPDASVDLVTVAQALHWFDVQAFHAEARRVARPGAVLAVWNYPRPTLADGGLERRFLDFYEGVVGPYWPPERRHIEANYSTLPFPFEELPHPDFALTLRWNLEQLLGYVSSWSATARYREARGEDPVPRLRAALQPVWPAAGSAQVRMPIGLRAGILRPGG
jgi:ubiquinone/menaquinone biosynthesis C-methylase UbiE